MSKTSTSPTASYSLEQAYDHCRNLAKRHYENFPVASYLLPRESRDAVAVIYAFAREADDFADEGEHGTAHRLALLDGYADALEQLAEGDYSGDNPVFIALGDVIRRHRLPLQLFHDLLSAFRQDVTKTRYRDFAELLDYCRRSANPVGRLMLHLNRRADEETLELSDNICSALQLINFLQDIEQDYRENNRIYLPQDEMEAFGVSENDIAESRSSAALVRLFDSQLARSAEMLHDGSRLGSLLDGRFGLEIRLIIEAGWRVTEKLAEHGGKLFTRPRLAKSDYLRIGWRALQRRKPISARAAPSSF